MQWYEEVLDRIDDQKTYCHKELMDELRLLKTDLPDSSYHWVLSGLVRDGALTRRGYDSYSLSSDHPKDVQVEKESGIYVFWFLQEQGIQNVMYKPGKKNFNLYWSKDC